MLGERQPEREAASVRVDPAARGFVEEPEGGAVERVHREPDCPPAPTARDGLSQERDVRVVVAQELPVERLGDSPDDRRGGAGRGGAQV